MRVLLLTTLARIPMSQWEQATERRHPGRVVFTTRTTTGAHISLVRDVVRAGLPGAPVPFERRYRVYFDHMLMGSEEYTAQEQTPEQSIGAFGEALYQHRC